MRDDAVLSKDLSSAEFELFRDYIHRHAGIFLEDEKVDSLRISLLARATRLGFADYADYYRVLVGDETEFKELLNLITINETSFFRFPAQFDALRDVVVPELIESRPSGALRSLRVWSAGCSTGEEPYTIAMTLLDSALVPKRYGIEVVGSDVSTQALERAREAVYPARSISSLEQEAVQRWFEPVRTGHRPVKAVRDLVRFHYHNLIKEPYPAAYRSGWDLIFCRNVTIYFRIESTRKVVDNFYEALNPGGYLFIGHSETLTSINERFEPVEIGGVFVYRKPHRVWSLESPVRRRLAGPGGWRELVRRREGPAAPGVTPVVPAVPATPAEPLAEAPPPAEVRIIAGREDAERLARGHELLEGAAAAGALAIAEDVLDTDPESRSARLLAAFAHADQGDLAGATAHVRSILDAEPLDAAAHYVLGTIYRQEGDIVGARDQFRASLYSDPDFVLAHFALASMARDSGKFDDASRSFENVVRSMSASPSGEWTQFLGGFDTELLIRSCERGLAECQRRRSES